MSDNLIDDRFAALPATEGIHLFIDLYIDSVFSCLFAIIGHGALRCTLPPLAFLY